tara:strand:- start:88 stop:1713 length:1626 start_codon:yes stop_codon:yes gene_type:complete
MPAVTEHQFKGGTMWSYDGQLYDKYEDIPFKTKQAYETAKSGLGTAAKATWEGIGNIPKVGQPTQHLLKNAAQVAAGTIQDLDEQEFKIPFTDIKTGIPTPGNLAVDALRIADKTLTAGSKLAEKEFGIYAPTAKVVGELAIDYLASGGAGKIAKGSKILANQADELFLGATRLDNLAYATVDIADEGLFKSVVRDVAATKFKPNTMFAATTTRVGSSAFKRTQRSPEVKQLYNTKLLRPDYIPEGDWKKLVIKFTEDASDVAEESARWGSELIKEAHDHFKVKGSLKDFGSIRIDPNTGKSWLIKNKRGKLDTQNMGPRFGIDSLEKTTAGRIIREATAKVNEKDVWKWAREIQEKNSDITDGMIKEYIKAQKAHKRDLQKLIKNLNYDEGKGTWSLGHREAVASFTKRGEVGADIIQNLELEPFRDMFNPKTGEWIRGNASRSAGAELERILLRAANQSTNIGEDILKFLDPDIGNFWPRMGEITNKAQWLKQTGLREQYYDNIRALAKKEGISLQEAADEYLLDIMSKTKRSQAPLFN